MFTIRLGRADTVWSTGLIPPDSFGGPLICVSNFHRSRHAWSADRMFTPEVGGPPELRVVTRRVGSAPAGHEGPERTTG